MLDADSSRSALEKLFAHRPVADLPQLGDALGTHSRMSIFRRLSSLGYVSSYSHTGRYYALTSVADFDADGLWRYQGIGFSRDGTLKATVLRLVEGSDAGRTQRELRVRLGVRVHNPLLELVESKRLGRESFEAEYIYVSAKRALAATQMQRRGSLAALAPVIVEAPSIEVEVLLEVIHGTRLPDPNAELLSARLVARGVRVNVAEVAAVLERHGLKKRAPSRSRRSKR
ncbi:MAG: hypothetical protein AAB295_11675 [Chloroflexota bacterium]